MTSLSCSTFMDFASGDLLGSPWTPRPLPRVMTVSGIMSDADNSEEGVSPSPRRERKILVANMLPLLCQRDTETGKWHFSWDDDALMLHLKDGFSPETEVIYVGSLNGKTEASEQEEVSQRLFDEFKCVPTFLHPDTHSKFYDGFCKQHLWPLFHYMLPIYPDQSGHFDHMQWQAYVSANKIFADKVMEVINPDDDFVWVHDYHLMIMPTFLRKRFNKVKLGFFLHSPFPSSGIYRTLPVRDEVLKGLLNCDLIGFHTFDYARHFLSCCSRMLGLDYESKRGFIGLDYFGRTVYLKILPIGINMGRLESVFNLSLTEDKLKEIHERYEGKTVILGVDDMDIFKGISLKLLAVEQLLKENPRLRGEVVLIQIVNPARSSGKDVQEAREEAYDIAKRINDGYGSEDYEPIVLIDRPVPRYEKSAYYALAECCIVTAVRDGMNLVPYKYIVCRQGTTKLNNIMGVEADCPRTSTLVVSEFVGCSPSLSGAMRVNPWDIENVAKAINSALRMTESEKRLRHKKHYRYVSSHDVGYWARSFMQDLERACQDHYNKRCWGIGLGLGFRVVALSPSFRRLAANHIISAYRRTNRRAIFLDYDGTLVSQNSVLKTPSPELLAMLNTISGDPRNTVFIVSGRGRSSLSKWLASCNMLGIAAEHGYFIRWSGFSDWETSLPAANLGFKGIVEPIMETYTEATDGSNIEFKESALVWHHQDADPDFGACQSMELLNHLGKVLANEPAVVKRGQHIVEVKPQGVSKGLVAEKVLSGMIKRGTTPDFVMCIGDDRSDEDMFESILDALSSSVVFKAPEIFACTVGQKPSKARYYLEDTSDVVNVLQGLALVSDRKLGPGVSGEVSFDSIFGQ